MGKEHVDSRNIQKIQQYLMKHPVRKRKDRSSAVQTVGFLRNRLKMGVNDFNLALKQLVDEKVIYRAPDGQVWLVATGKPEV